MKRVLIISRIFAPCASVGGHRAVKLARRIGEHGWEPIVLTVPVACAQPIDPEFGKDVLSRCRIETVPCHSLWQHSQDWDSDVAPTTRVIRKAGRALDGVIRRAMPFDMAYFWMKAAQDKGVSIVRRSKVDLIWATSPLFSALILAHTISRRTGVPFIADFRDVPLAGAGTRGMSRRLYQVERTVVRDCSALTYVSRPQLDTLLARYPRLNPEKTRLIHNWFEDSDADVKPTRFVSRTILHGGVLYGGNRRLDGFLQALRRLREDGENSGLQFLQHSIEKDLSFLERECQKYNVSSAVRIGGPLSRREFLAACRGSDVLLLAVGRDADSLQHAGAIPGKLYDYLAACRPILVIGPVGCEAGRIVEELRRGIAVPDDSPDQISHAILQLLNNQGRPGPLRLDVASAGQFESRGAMQVIASLFDELLAAQRGQPNRGASS